MRTIITAQLFGKKLSIPVSQITHFTSGDKYVTAHYPGGELLIDESLTYLEDEFRQYLTRTHRGVLVKTHLIESLVRHIESRIGEVKLEGVEQLLPVSKANIAKVGDILRARRYLASVA